MGSNIGKTEENGMLTKGALYFPVDPVWVERHPVSPMGQKRTTSFSPRQDTPTSFQLTSSQSPFRN